MSNAATTLTDAASELLRRAEAEGISLDDADGIDDLAVDIAADLPAITAFTLTREAQRIGAARS